MWVYQSWKLLLAEWKGSFSSSFEARFAECPFCGICTWWVYLKLLLSWPNLVCVLYLLTLLSPIDSSVYVCNPNNNATGDANQSVHLVAGEGLEAYLPLADMVDVSSEVERLTKRLSKMQAEYDALVARLKSSNVWTLIAFISIVSFLQVHEKQTCFPAFTQLWFAIMKNLQYHKGHKPFAFFGKLTRKKTGWLFSKLCQLCKYWRHFTPRRFGMDTKPGCRKTRNPL